MQLELMHESLNEALVYTVQALARRMERIGLVRSAA